jgi:imidazolonepropionase
MVRNARLMTCDPARPGLGIVERGSMLVHDGRIAWLGPDADRPQRDLGYDDHEGGELDAQGALVTPGLVDCHTHAIFAGDRANEFAMRAEGAGYLEIAKAGGGINATLGPTRTATDDQLLQLLEGRLARALAGGTTTIEIKTGYDLTVPGEMRLLFCIATAAGRTAQRLVPTLLAHLIPPERKETRDAFVEEFAETLVPAAAAERLATSVDVYCDDGAFTLAETTKILRAAHRHGLRVRGHVGQFADLGAAQLLGELSALSADHVEQISDDGIAALARARTVAVMLPGACVQLKLPVPPVAKLRAAGVRMAIASDMNPGSSNCETLPVQMWLATTHFGMSVEEAWLGVTRHAAAALDVADAGALVTGARADFVVWRCDEPAHVPYRYGTNLVESVCVDGTLVELAR